MVYLTPTAAMKPATDVTWSNRTMSDSDQLAEKEKNSRTSGKWDVIIPNPKLRKTPRLCFFVTSLVFLMVAAVVVVLVIKHSLSRRDVACCEIKPASEDVKQTSFEKNKNRELDISWEMKQAFSELRQSLGDFKPKVLFPVYRKDLLPHYIAYYEVKLEHAQGQSYAVISAGEGTGDYSLVETGALPSPLDKLRDKAYLNGHYCSKFFRLTVDGVTICEDHRVNKIVATTRDIYPESPVRDWKQLDEQVSKALPTLKREWRKLAKEAKKLKEWQALGKAPKKSSDKPYSDHDGAVTEKGLHPGEFTEIPVENITEMRIKFAGLSKIQRRTKATNTSLRKWQTKLCKILNHVCNPRKPTTFRKGATILNFSGSKYLRFGVNNDENYVRAELKNEEIRFQVELKIGSGKLIIMRYGVVLKEKRLGRSVGILNYVIPEEKSFTNIPYNKECESAGTMFSAWAMIFSYYDSLGKSRPELGYKRLRFKKSKLGRHFSTLKKRQSYITEIIASKVGMKCHSSKQTRQHWDKSKLDRWFKQSQGVLSRIMYIGGPDKLSKATRKAIHLLKKGIPVIISKDQEFTVTPQYGVVTRLRQRRSSYRRCDQAGCSSWEQETLTEFFVRDGWSKGKWQYACTYYVAAALRV